MATPSFSATAGNRGFQRLDALMALLAVVLWGLLALPLLANTSLRSERVHCLSNLRRIGQGFHIWGADHDNRRPFRVPVSQGGTMPDAFVPKVGNAWYEFAWISNELATPKLLACPSDARTARVARNFSSQPDGGLLHVSYRNNAVSYFLNVDVLWDMPPAILSGDRNLRVDAVGSGCSSRINNAATIYTSRTSLGCGQVAWTNSIHQFMGNVLFDDGRVQESANTGLCQLFSQSDDNGSVHVLMPK